MEGIRLLRSSGKKIIILLLMITISFFTKAEKRPYLLEGETSLSLNGKKIVLVVRNIYNARPVIKDTVIIKNARFQFKGELTEPSQPGYLYLPDEPHALFNLVVEEGTLRLKVRALPAKWPLKENILSNTIVFDSRSNELTKRLDSLSIYYYETFGLRSGKGIKLHPEKAAELWMAELNTISEYKDVFASLLFLRNLLGRRPDQVVLISHLMDSLAEPVVSTELGVNMKSEISGRLKRLKGQKAITFELATSSGGVINSDSLANRVVMLVFGATWCGPCKENYPALKELYKKYHSTGLEIVSINLDEKRELWLKQIQQYEMRWINASELTSWQESKIVKDFGIDAIPLILLIDRNGIVADEAIQINDAKNIEKMDASIVKALKN